VHELGAAELVRQFADIILGGEVRARVRR